MGQTNNWQGAAHVQSVTPAYGNYPMGSLMCERPDSGNTCFIWTMDGGNGGDQGTYQLDGTWVYPSLMSVINQPNEIKVNVGTYGHNQLQTGLWLRSDTNSGYSGGDRSGSRCLAIPVVVKLHGQHDRRLEPRRLGTVTDWLRS